MRKKLAYLLVASFAAAALTSPALAAHHGNKAGSTIIANR